MASIFTFDPDPPRVSSPWSTPPPGSKPQQRILQDSSVNALSAVEGTKFDSPITRLEAEPQDGPTEYKLHLLLRRRRSFVQTSTGRHVSGSFRRTEPPSSGSRSASESNLANTPPALSSSQSRQHRLEQLTTQLLWRLQQSSPYHSSSANALILPHLPDESQLSIPTVPRRLLPGLEESKGALYEIGVADDGTFVGLSDDEMEESLNNLRAMAASLGCCVDILRMVAVGDCEWIEDVEVDGEIRSKSLKGKLRVAEAFVRPNLDLVERKPNKDTEKDLKHPPLNPKDQFVVELGTNELFSPTDQLRISLTGATMSGKSSLLGSLSTATLDNGRGKSRLSLLKHRHEIASGMTSSVTQELIGYHDFPAQSGTTTCTQVINYASGNVSSWIDIHAAAEGGRLVFLSDSAGHPRFRRTTVRGLVGWAPHWTLLCIPADSAEDAGGKAGSTPSPQDVLGPAAAEVDLSQAHLELCLKLELPLVVVITKLDIATKTGLRQTLSKLLSALKSSGKKPSILSETSGLALDSDLHTIPSNDLLEARKSAETAASSCLSTVPIVLTSAVKGTGISKLHALLRELPIPEPATHSALPASTAPTNASPSTLFHIEDIYSTLAPSKPLALPSSDAEKGVIIGGHLRYGTLSIGDELLLGPYPIDVASDDSDSGSGRGGSSPPQRSSPVPTSRSFPGALHKGANPTPLRPVQYSNEKHHEWRRVRITSVRNLRLPVRTLHAGQVGTMGIVPLDQPIASPAIVRVRRGMVLANGEPRANRVIRVKFNRANADAVRSLSIGSAVVLYVASVRASAKIVSVATGGGEDAAIRPRSLDDDDDDGGFGFGFDDDEEEEERGNRHEALSRDTVVTFQFIASREFVEPNAQVLVIPGGGPGLYGGTERGEKGVAGLEGFVGRMVEGYG